jgi:hypothetical protein
VFARRGGEVGTPQESPDARQELVGAERLGQVVIGTHLEAHYSIDLAASCSQHDDGYIARRPDAPAQGQAVLLWQHDVEYEQIDATHFKRPIELAALPRDAHAVAILSEEIRHQGSDIGIVLDEEKVRRLLHDFLIGQL